MGILLFLLGLLAIASGGFKLRERIRFYVGSSPLALAEIVLGAVTVLASGVGLGRQRPIAWTVVGGLLVLIAASAVIQARRAVQHGKSRERSEDARLRTYLGERADPAAMGAHPNGKPDESDE